MGSASKLSGALASDWALEPAEVVALIQKGAWARVGFSAASALIASAVLSLAWAALWLAATAIWEFAVRPMAERAFVLRSRDKSQQFTWLAAIHLCGASLYTALAVAAWLTATPIGMVLATAWVSASANHVFVYFSSNRLLLAANLAPVLACTLLAPFAAQGFTLTAALGALVMVGLVAGAGMFGYDRRVLLQTLSKQEAARTAAEQANAFKSHFLASMGHELRVPLSSVIGYAELIAEESDGAHAADATKITDAARRMLGLVNVVVDMARIESGKVALRRERTKVAAVLEQVREAALPLAMVKRNQLLFADARGLGEANIDHNWLHQGLMQVMANSAHSTSDGVIRVAASRGEREGRAALIFEIRDTGQTLSHAQCETAFEPFQNGRGGEGGDTGLGLPFARQIARLMGGDATCEPLSQGGVKFTFWIAADAAH
jgi:signal transduction histidine kinase